MNAEYPTESSLPQEPMVELAPIAPPKESGDSYMNRYKDGVPDAEAHRATYPHFPSSEEVRERVAATTKIIVHPDSDIGQTGEALPVVTKQSPYSLMLAFKGDIVEAYKEGGINILDPRLELSSQVEDGFMQELIDDTSREVNLKQSWWQDMRVEVGKRTNIGEDIAEGRLSEAFEIRQGDKAITILNLDRPLGELEEMRLVIEQVAKASKGAIFHRVKILALQHASRFEDGTGGEHYHERDLITVNTLARDCEVAETEIVKDNGWSPFQNVIAHELGHALDVQQANDEDKQILDQHADLDTGHPYVHPMASAFSRPLGWHMDTMRFEHTDDDEILGPAQFTTYHHVHGIQGPAKEILTVGPDGIELKVQTEEHFASKDIQKDLPVTPYAYTNPPEDYAEAFRKFALEGPQSIGVVRRAVIEHTLSRLVSDKHINYSIPVEAKKIDFHELNTTPHIPKEKHLVLRLI